MVEKVKNSKLCILLLLTGAVYFFLKYIVNLVAPILSAMLFLTIFGSCLQKLRERYRIPRQLGALLLLLIAGTVLGILIWLLFSWVVGSLPGWITGMESLEQDMVVIVREASATVGGFLGVDHVYLEETILNRVGEGIDTVTTKVMPGVLSQSLENAKIAGALGAFLITFLISTVLLAKDYDEIMNNMLEREEFHVVLEVICGIIRYIATFVKAQLIIMGCVGLVAAIVLSISGIRHGALWGSLAGILDAFPFVGTGVVLVPLCIVQLFYGNYGVALACAILYVVCIFLREMLEPKLIGKQMGVTPIAILISLYAGIQLFGVGGIIKGPLGFMIIYHAYRSILKRNAAFHKPDALS